MVSLSTTLSEKRYTFLFTVAFLLLCLSLLILLFTTNTATNRLFSSYYPSPSNSKDLQKSQSFPPPGPPPQPLGSPVHIRPQISPPIPYTNPILGASPSTDDNALKDQGKEGELGAGGGEPEMMRWKICRGQIGPDYIPCLDNLKAIKQLNSWRHMEHRERHCPKPTSRCLVPLPAGYKIPLAWPRSRNMIWFDNVPHPKLVEYKKDQNWVRKSGDYLVFPGGGTQFKGGVTSYIQFIEQTLPTIDWGRHTRVILDVGCGVASFGGYLLDRGVITMSFAPKDEHEAQIQFALERGVPAILSVIGTQRLTFPDNVYDMIHCARCRVHWDADGGKPLLELNRILRPGGFFIWSATPVYRNDARDTNIWNAMVALTESICWKTVVKSKDGAGIGLVIYQKPASNTCYKERIANNPPLCDPSDRPNVSWYTPLESCLPQLPRVDSAKGQKWPNPWPERLISRPLGEPSSIYAVENFYANTKYWETLVSDIYLHKLAINWSSIRNVIDMNAGFGGFAAALINQPVWVMNTVPVSELDTLPVIFNRGLIGIYHDWCESFNTYPRTYDLLHSSYLFGNLTRRCDIVNVLVEMDRILRPNGWVLVQDNIEIIKKLQPILQSLHWETRIHEQQILVGRKGFWRPAD